MFAHLGDVWRAALEGLAALLLGLCGAAATRGIVAVMMSIVARGMREGPAALLLGLREGQQHGRGSRAAGKMGVVAE